MIQHLPCPMSISGCGSGQRVACIVYLFAESLEGLNGRNWWRGEIAPSLGTRLNHLCIGFAVSYKTCLQRLGCPQWVQLSYYCSIYVKSLVGSLPLVTAFIPVSYPQICLCNNLQQPNPTRLWTAAPSSRCLSSCNSILNPAFGMVTQIKDQR